MVAQLQEEGVSATVLAVSVDDRRQAMARTTRRKNVAGLTFAWSPDLGKAMRVSNLPTTFVIGPDGVLRARYQGYTSDQIQELEDTVRQLAR